MNSFDELLTHNRNLFERRVQSVKSRFTTSAVRRFMDNKPFRVTTTTAAQRHAAEQLASEYPNRWEFNDGVLSLMTHDL